MVKNGSKKNQHGSLTLAFVFAIRSNKHKKEGTPRSDGTQRRQNVAFPFCLYD